MTLLVSDKEASEKFYIGGLGLEKYDADGHLWVKIGRQFIHISKGEAGQRSFFHFAIEVEGVREYAKMLVSRGIDVFDLDNNEKEILKNVELDKSVRQFFLKDPDGNLLELVDTNNSFFVPE